MTNQKQNRLASFRIMPPYGSAFSPNVDGSINIQFNLDDIDKIDEWCNGVANLAKEVLKAEKVRADMMRSQLDRAVVLKPATADRIPEGGMPPKDGESFYPETLEELSKMSPEEREASFKTLEACGFPLEDIQRMKDYFTIKEHYESTNETQVDTH